MPIYSYVYVNKEGKEKKAIMESRNEEQVIMKMKSEGHTLISIGPQSMINKDFDLGFGKRISPRDYSVFCRKFVSILKAGVSIIRALAMLSEQTENKILAAAIKETQIAVEKGESLSDAMKAREKIFPEILIHMVVAGEASGNLEISFERMALQFEKDAKIRSQMKKAMIYPIVVGLVALGVIFAMLLFVIPNFMGMFADMDMELPAMTQMVVNMSEFVQSRWYVILGVMIIAVVAFRLFERSSYGKAIMARLAFKTPLFGSLTIKATSSRFSRTISTLLAAGISMIDALDICAQVIGNEVAKDVLLEAKEDVARGLPLSEAITGTEIFPTTIWQMAKIGEETGEIGEMLEKMADYYDEEVEIAKDSLMALMEPLIIVVLALIVGVLIMSIMQPMMSLYSGLDNL